MTLTPRVGCDLSRSSKSHPMAHNWAAKVFVTTPGQGEECDRFCMVLKGDDLAA